MTDKVTIRVGGAQPVQAAPPVSLEPPVSPAVTVSDVITDIVTPKAIEPPAPPVLPMITEPAVDLPPPPEPTKVVEIVATPVSGLTRTVTIKQATAIPAVPPILPSPPAIPIVNPPAAPTVKQVVVTDNYQRGVTIMQRLLYLISVLILLSAIWITYSRINNKPLSLISHTTEAEKTIVIPPTIEQPVEAPKKVVKVPPVEVRSLVGVKKYYVAYQLSNGQIEKRTGGSRSWRLNNPGRLIDSNYSRAYGALGVSEKMAIFPTYQAGRKALIDMFFVRPEMKWMDHTIESAIKNFVPASVAKDYLDEILKLVPGVTKATIMKTFTPEQREAFANAIEQLEVFQKGRVEMYDNIDIYKEKG